MGLSVPDPKLRFDENRSEWIHGPIDWDEFWRVIRGDGPCNHERMQARRQAHENGAWVRAALQAYAYKHG
jgi:ring-1,2-phenylacetyl-CoA epoxidase subunit PaaA